MTQYHEKEWRLFAYDQHLNLKRVPGISSIEYVHAPTRLARAAWDRRSELEASAEGPKAYYNAAIQHASELVYRAHGQAAAKAIQELKQ